MSNLTAGTRPRPYGQGGRKVYLPMSATAQVWEGAMLAETAAGAVVTATTAGAGDVIGIAESDMLGGASDGATRVAVMYDQIFTLNASGSGAPTDATAFGTIVYADTDNTITTTAGSNPKAGKFVGMTDDGRVRVFVGVGAAAQYALQVASRSGALAVPMTGSADTNGTPNTPINIGSVLPARAIVLATEVTVTTSATVNATAKLDVGWSGAQDALIDGLDLIASAPGEYGHNDGDATGAKAYPVTASGKQLTYTVTPDGSSKLSAMLSLVGTINVYYVVPF